MQRPAAPGIRPSQIGMLPPVAGSGPIADPARPLTAEQVLPRGARAGDRAPFHALAPEMAAIAVDSWRFGLAWRGPCTRRTSAASSRCLLQTARDEGGPEPGPLGHSSHLHPLAV